MKLLFIFVFCVQISKFPFVSFDRFFPSTQHRDLCSQWFWNVANGTRWNSLKRMQWDMSFCSQSNKYALSHGCLIRSRGLGSVGSQQTIHFILSFSSTDCRLRLSWSVTDVGLFLVQLLARTDIDICCITSTSS